MNIIVPLALIVLLSGCSTCVQSHLTNQSIPKFRHEETVYVHADKTKWHNFIKGVNNLESVNQKINSIPYREEDRQHDYWKSPTELVSDGFGDCEDYALAKFHALKDLGYDESRLKITIVRDSALRYHAVLLVDDKLILDNEKQTIDNLTESDYILVYSVNNSGVYSYE